MDARSRTPTAIPAAANGPALATLATGTTCAGCGENPQSALDDVLHHPGHEGTARGEMVQERAPRDPRTVLHFPHGRGPVTALEQGLVGGLDELRAGGDGPLLLRTTGA